MHPAVRRFAGTAGVVTALALQGCHPATPGGAVPLEGSPADLSAIAGVWTGRYWSEGTGRHGTITFRLRAGADTARGQVEMTFSPSLRLYPSDCPAGEMPAPRPPCTVIDIAVVRVHGGLVRGTLAPYWDPDCDCRTATVFEGKLAGDHISGSFTSRRDRGPVVEVTGRWLADRGSG
jgi:hypothetical protein